MAQILSELQLQNKLTTDYNMFYENFVQTYVTTSGFAKSELTRQNMTISYHVRFMIMFMIGQCLLYVLGQPIISKASQTCLYTLMNNVRPFTSNIYPMPNGVPPTTIFNVNANPSWTTSMQSVHLVDVQAIDQMMEYVYGDHDVTKIANTSVWSSYIFGNLQDLLVSLKNEYQ